MDKGSSAASGQMLKKEMFGGGGAQTGGSVCMPLCVTVGGIGEGGPRV